MSSSIVRIYVPGGILSPGELRRIANAANYLGVQDIHLGNRQDVLLKIKKKDSEELKKRLNTGQYDFTIGSTEHDNIITSFAASNLYNTTNWLTEGQYLEILSNFNYLPKLKINIVDPQQALVSLFSGDLNFIASHHDNYWFLFIKFPGKEQPEMWPVLVDGNEIAHLSETIEKFFFSMNQKLNLIQLETFVYNDYAWNFRIIDVPFKIRPVRFVPYEGLHPMGERYWLGIFQRDNSYSVNFIDNLCILCGETNIGSIHLTPWSSFLIKNIDEKHLDLWERLLGKHGINTGHSQLELNWQLPEFNVKAFQLKQYIYHAFEKTGLRTDGLVFSVTTGKKLELPGSVYIIKKPLFSIPNVFDFFPMYEIKYRKGFDLNSSEMVSFAGGLKRRNLPNILSYLCSQYYDSLTKQSGPGSSKVPDFKNDQVPKKKEKKVHQCKSCLTVYDAAFGDELAGIIAGTSFSELPAEYKCSVCDAPKSNFSLVQLEGLVEK